MGFQVGGTLQYRTTDVVSGTLQYRTTDVVSFFIIKHERCGTTYINNHVAE
jgi:hypothetical protein